MNGRVGEPEKFFRELGNLHDARVRQILWSPERSELAVTLDDLHSNFAGLPEYQGLRPQVVILEGVADLMVSAALSEPHLNIHDFEVTSDPSSRLRVHVTFWPHGNTTVHCSGLRLEDCA